MTDTEATPTNASTESSALGPVAPPADSVAPALSVAESVMPPAVEWRTISVKPRVDSFNHQELLDELAKARGEGCLSIALDLRGNRFLSFPVIKLCTDIARELYDKGGRFALLSYSEKTRRHFEIYGSVKYMCLAKDEGELPLPKAAERAPIKTPDESPSETPAQN